LIRQQPGGDRPTGGTRSEGIGEGCNHSDKSGMTQDDENGCGALSLAIGGNQLCLFGCESGRREAGQCLKLGQRPFQPGQMKCDGPYSYDNKGCDQYGYKQYQVHNQLSLNHMPKNFAGLRGISLFKNRLPRQPVRPPSSDPRRDSPNPAAGRTLLSVF